MALVRVDASELSGDPSRLSDEAYAIPMFGGRRAVTVRVSGNASLAAALEPLFAQPPEDTLVLVSAGELRKTSPLRKLFAAEKAAISLPCYADDAGALDALIEHDLSEAGLAIEPDAKAALQSLIGADRLTSRSEVAKLCLYADGDGTVTLDHIRAVVGDASAFAIDDTVDAAALGDAAGFSRLYARLVAAGTNDYAVIGAAIRHFDMLHRSRAAVDRGMPSDRAIGPQIFFKRKAAVGRQLGLWSLPRIERALTILNRAVVDSRLKNSIGAEVVGQAMLSVAAIAQAGSRRRRS